jgi:hypothetical protein
MTGTTTGWRKSKVSSDRARMDYTRDSSMLVDLGALLFSPGSLPILDAAGG